MHSGKRIDLGGQEYIVPPLSLGQVRQFQQSLEELPRLTGTALLLAAVPVIHAAMTRNYPDLPISEVERLIDMRNFREVMPAVTGIGEGETKPAASDRIGAPSTGASLPSPAGHGTT